MLDTITINTLEQEYENLKKCEEILRNVGVNVGNNAFKYICDRVANLVIQDVVTEIAETIEVLESDKDKQNISLVINQLYGRYGQL